MPKNQHLKMWEIYVPTHDNDGQKYPVEHHQQWDGFVQELCGGQTILKVAHGRWIDPATSILYDETMIPVRIACSREQIQEIGHHTLQHYNQLKVLAHRVGSEVLFFEQTPAPIAA